MSIAPRVLLGGEPSDWPGGLAEKLTAAGFHADFVGSVPHMSLPVLSGEACAIVVDARTLSFGDLVTLRQLRGKAPALALVVVGSSAASQAMKDALDTDATAFVPRSQIEALIVPALRTGQRTP